MLLLHCHLYSDPPGLVWSGLAWSAVAWGSLRAAVRPGLMSDCCPLRAANCAVHPPLM